MCLTRLMPDVRVAGFTVADKIITLLRGQRCTAAPAAYKAHGVFSPLNLLYLCSRLSKDRSWRYGNRARVNKRIPGSAGRGHGRAGLSGSVPAGRQPRVAGWRQKNSGGVLPAVRRPAGLLGLHSRTACPAWRRAPGRRECCSGHAGPRWHTSIRRRPVLRCFVCYRPKACRAVPPAKSEALRRHRRSSAETRFYPPRP